MNRMSNVIEAILFAAGKKVSKSDFSDKFPELTDKEFRRCIAEIKEKYSGDSGITLLCADGEYQFSTNAEYGDEVASILARIRDKELTPALMETLAIVAYRQPITRSEIERLRNNINCDYALAKLIENKLVKVVGVRDTIGKPYVFGTTTDFLIKFNLSSIDDLPERTELIGEIDKIEENFYQQNKKDLFGVKPLEDSSQIEYDTDLATQAAFREMSSTEDYSSTDTDSASQAEDVARFFEEADDEAAPRHSTSDELTRQAIEEAMEQDYNDGASYEGNADSFTYEEESIVDEDDSDGDD